MSDATNDQERCHEIAQLTNFLCTGVKFPYSCHTLVIFNAKPLHIPMAAIVHTNVPCHTPHIINMCAITRHLQCSSMPIHATRFWYFQCKVLTHLNLCENAYQNPMPHYKYIFNVCAWASWSVCILATPSKQFNACSCHTLVIFNAKPLHILMAVKMHTNVPCHTPRIFNVYAIS